MNVIETLAHLYPLCHLFFYFQKNQFKERDAYMKYIELFWNRLYYCIFFTAFRQDCVYPCLSSTLSLYKLLFLMEKG